MATYTNYILNPSAETNVSNISAAAGGTTITRVNTGATKGSWAAEAACSGSGSGQGLVFLSATGIGGTSVPIDAQFDITAAAAGQAMVANIRWFYTDASNAFATNYTFTLAAATTHITVPQRISSSTKTLDYFAVLITISGTAALTFQVDGVSAGDSTMYIDGDQGDDYAWTGTAHASASTYTEPPNGYLDILPINGTNADAPTLTIP